jgi:hypothetical protein
MLLAIFGLVSEFPLILQRCIHTAEDGIGLHNQVANFIGVRMATTLDN